MKITNDYFFRVNKNDYFGINRFSFILTIILTLCVFAGITSAATYYVDYDNGSDSASGSSSSPWRTIQRALPNSTSSPRVSDGDTVIISARAGGASYGDVEYILRRDTGTRNWITYRAENPSNKPKINSFYVDDTPNVYMIFENISFDNANNTSRDDAVHFDGTNSSLRSSHVKFINCYARVARSGQAMYFRRSEDITIDGCEAVNGYRNINLNDCADVIITNNDCHNSWNDALDIKLSDNITIEDNLIYDVDIEDTGSHCDAMSIADTSNVTVRRNTLWEIHGQGIYTINDFGTNCSNVIIESNLVYGVVHSGMLKLHNVNGLIVRNNTIAGEGASSSVADDCTNVQFYNNIIACSYSVNSSNTQQDYNIFTQYNTWGGANPIGPNSRNLSSISAIGFVNPAAYDFRLTANSPAIDNSPTSYAAPLDITGSGRNGLADAGAHEYDGTTPPTEPPLPPSDTDAPQLVAATAGANWVTVQFDEALDAQTAENINNYDIDNNAIVISASLSAAGNSVTLQTSQNTENTDYTLTVAGIEDLAGNAINAAQVSYTYTVVDPLIGHWQFDEASGDIAVDSSTYGNDALLVNSPTRTADGAITFDGNNDAVECNTENLNADSGTVALWANPAAFGSSVQFMFGHVANGWANRIQIYTNDTNGSLGIGLGDSHRKANGIYNMQAGAWHHVTLTWANGSYTVYVDGTEVNNGTYTGLAAISTYADVANTGNRDDRAEAFNGSIDDVRVYNRALNTAEVASIVNPVNHPPQIAAIGDKAVDENSQLDFTVSVDDADGDLLALVAEPLPPGATFSDTTGQFTWTPSFDQAGVYSMTIVADDGELEDSETIRITVNNVNRAPAIANIADKTVSPGDSVSITVNASDADGDAVTCNVQNAPAGADFSNDTFTWTPAENQAGDHIMSFIASDGELEDVETVTITVDNVNRAPELDAIGNKSVNVNQTISFTLNATDADGDALTYSANPLPAGAELIDDTFTWTPTTAQASNYTVTFYVTDGQFGDMETINISVNDAANVDPIIIDNSSAATSYTGTWKNSSGANPYGEESLWSRDGATYTWTFTPEVSGSYDVEMYWTYWQSRTDSAPVAIQHADGTDTVYVNQLVNGGNFNLLGQYYFQAGVSYDITITAQSAPASTCADAVKFTKVDDGGQTEPPVPPVDGTIIDGLDGFTYIDDAFYGTNQPGYAHEIATTDASLKLQVGGTARTRILDMSAGFTQTFTLDAEAEVTFSFDYQMTQTAHYEDSEYSEALFSINGVLVGRDGNECVDYLVGDGNNGPEITTGPQNYTITYPLPAGTYTITIGAYNNKKTLDNEATEMVITDVNVSTN